MNVKQISVFLENKTGRLADITKTLGKNDIDISALSIADTTHFGILRLIVNKPDEAEKVLREDGFTVNISPVLAVGVEDCPGALAKALSALAAANIEIDYIYAFVGKTLNKALVIMKVEDIDMSADILRNAGITVLSQSEVYSL